MAEGTAISWAHDTFNPWEGCTRVSPACDHCYAAARAHRFGNARLWAGELRRTSPANWKKPLRWNAEAALSAAPRRVFCASLADVFDNQAPQEWREDLWALIEATPNLTWLLLTKRPQNIQKMLPKRWWPLIGEDLTVTRPAPKNIWVGTTVEDQERADQRLAILASIAGNFGWLPFVSAEPLLGPLDLTSVAVPGTQPGRYNALTGDVAYAALHANRFGGSSIGRMSFPPLGLVIAGGESGKDARPSHPDLFRSLRDQCAASDVAFHFKQWGEFAPTGDAAIRGYARPMFNIGNELRVAWPDGSITDHGRSVDHGGLGHWIKRVGTAKAGRLLDGVLHDGMPT